MSPVCIIVCSTGTGQLCLLGYQAGTPTKLGVNSTENVHRVYHGQRDRRTPTDLALCTVPRVVVLLLQCTIHATIIACRCVRP